MKRTILAITILIYIGTIFIFKDIVYNRYVPTNEVRSKC